jgi:hypothetical protein
LEEKIRLCIVLPTKTDKELRSFIHKKQGSYKKGDLSKWVNISIRNLIKQEQQQHTTCYQHGMSKEEEMISTLTELMKDISSYFWKLDNPFPFRCGIDIHKKTLKSGISNIRGGDYRTSKKWIERLLDYGFIRKASNNQYKILNDGHESYDIKQEEREQKEREFDKTMEDLK